ncbi:unnamed protein product [Polarella glacialis]|uniref:GTP-binding nuclear protein n=1 Tax=Polarella glacialis TaxID=89957 RepID=A0A813FA67_POLGL|nr:unnamed protein product [Polarella glacialis]
MLSQIFSLFTRGVKRRTPDGDDAAAREEKSADVDQPPVKRPTLASSSSPSSTEQAQDPKSFKMVLLGDWEVGKTALVRRLLTGEFQKLYRPTEGCEMSRLKLATSRGPVVFEVWDTAGLEQLGGLKDGYYVRADCAIVLFDVTNRESFSSVQRWLQDFRRVAGQVPVVVAGNKIDLKDRAVKAQESAGISRRHGVQYYDLSVKSRFNLQAPLLWLVRRLLQEPSLQLTVEVAHEPQMPSFLPSLAERKQAERDLAEARSVAIGSDSDEDL